MDAITRYTGDALSRAESWTSLDPAERKRRAITALRDKRVADLWSLTEAHLTLYGKSGTKLSSHTAAAYRTSIAQLLVYWSGVSLTRPTRDQAALLVRAMERDGKSSSTITVRLAGARALYRALRWAGAVEIDPLADVRPAKDSTPAHMKRQPYSETDVRALLAVAAGEDRILVLLMAHAGLRISEAMALQWQHIDLTTDRLLVAHGKGGKAAWVSLSRTLAGTLRGAAHQNDYVISGYRSDETARLHMRRLCREAGVMYKSLHSLRHYCGSRLQGQLGDISRVAAHLRHSSVNTTAAYVHWSDTALKDAVGDW